MFDLKHVKKGNNIDSALEKKTFSRTEEKVKSETTADNFENSIA